MPDKSALKLTNIFRTQLFTDINFTDFIFPIFTDIIIHAKASSVQVMSVIIMSDNVSVWKALSVPDPAKRPEGRGRPGNVCGLANQCYTAEA